MFVASSKLMDGGDIVAPYSAAATAAVHCIKQHLLEVAVALINAQN